MYVGVTLRSTETDDMTTVELHGDLKDLSATGCLVEFYMQDGVSRVLPDLATEIELYFPNGTTFHVQAKVRHLKTDHDRQVLAVRSEEHTSELQSRENLVCRLLLEKNKH